MSDITPLLAELLKPHNARLKSSRRRGSDTEDTFLQEAYRINAHISSLHNYLLSIRRPYLSNAPPPRRPLPSEKRSGIITTLTNPQRDQIDTETKSLLSTLAGSIQQLVTAERLRQDTEREVLRRKRGGALRRWANGDLANWMGGQQEEEGEEEKKMKTTGAWRESVVWYLGRKLEGAGEVQRRMVEKRVERELEKSRSVLHMRKGSLAVANMSDTTARGGGGGGGGTSPGLPTKWPGEEEEKEEEEESTTTTTTTMRMNGSSISKGGGGGRWQANALAPTELAEINESLTPEQLQLFEVENNELLTHYNDRLSQVRTAQSSLLEISSLQTQLVQNLDVQSAHIQQLVTDSLNTTDNVASGNKQLKKAVERRSIARDVFYATCGLCITLVVWDLIF